MVKVDYSKHLRIRKSKIHGRGIFTTVEIPKGERVIEYVGDKITKKESNRRAEVQLRRAAKSGTGSVYIFTLNQRHDIDGNVNYNRARLINHSCKPNCEVDIIRGRIWIISKRKIKEAEELSFDYGFDLDSFEDHPCTCGAPNCVGYIVSKNSWRTLKKKIGK